MAGYKRILLKLSGEALMGEDAYGINPKTIDSMVTEIAQVLSLGVEIAIVIGGGNIFRGVAGGAAGMDRATADYMGMLATMMNSLALQDALRQKGVEARVQSALRMDQVVEPYIRPRAIRAMKEGKRADVNGKPGKIKAMGLDLKRSDTPVVIQDFLSQVLEQVLNGVPKEEVLEYITNFRTEFKTRPGWEKGSPKRANNITEYQAKEKKQGKANMPGHVRASLNWNTLKRMNDDKYSMSITDGAKVIVCKIKDNPMGYTSVAYPVDELRLPQWFKDLPFADGEMETTVIDEKLENLIGVLEWDISSTRSDNTFSKLFDFE